MFKKSLLSHIKNHTALVALGIFLPMAAIADPFTDTLRKTYDNHPAILAERNTLKATEQDVPEAFTGFLPRIGANYDKGRQRVEYNNQNRPTENTTNKAATLSQPIFDGGDTIAKIGESRARVRGAQEKLRETETQVLLRTIAAYADMAEKQTVMDLATENVDALRQQLEGTRKQFGVGDVTVSSVSESEARLARAEAEWYDARAALEAARETYIRETGEAPSITTLPPLPQGLPSSESEIAALAENSPAARRAEANETAADYRIDQHISEFLPSVRVDGNLRKTDGSTTPGLNTAEERSLVMRVSVPIFQSGAEYTRLKRARYEYQRSKDDRQDISRQTRQIALSAWHDYLSASDAIAAHNAANQSAEAAYNNVKTEQLAGTRTVLDVLNARQELFVSRTNLVRAQSRQIISAYKLLAATDRLQDALFSAPVEMAEKPMATAPSAALPPQPENSVAVTVEQPAAE